MKKSGKRKGKEVYVYYAELESTLDLARYIAGYGPGAYVKAVKEAANYRLLAAGEKLGDVRIVYYSDVKSIADFLIYSPESEKGERFELADKPGQPDLRSFRAPVIELLSEPYSKVKDLSKAEKVINVEVRDPDALAKSIAGLAHDEDEMPRLYAFYSKNDHIIGTFDLFHESNAKVFAFARTKIRETFSALAYNYTTDTVERANNFSDRSAVYIRAINLKKPFPFF